MPLLPCSSCCNAFFCTAGAGSTHEAQWLSRWVNAGFVEAAARFAIRIDKERVLGAHPEYIARQDADFRERLGEEGMRRLDMTGHIINAVSGVFNTFMKDLEEETEGVWFELPVPQLRKFDQQMDAILEPFVKVAMEHLVSKHNKMDVKEQREKLQATWRRERSSGQRSADAREIEEWLTVMGGEVFSATRLIGDFNLLYKDALPNAGTLERVMQAAAKGITPDGLTRLLDLAFGYIDGEDNGSSSRSGGRLQGSSSSSGGAGRVVLQLQSCGAAYSIILLLHQLAISLSFEQRVRIITHKPYKVYLMKLFSGDMQLARKWQKSVTADLSTALQASFALLFLVLGMTVVDATHDECSEEQQQEARRALRVLCDAEWGSAVRAAVAW